MAKPHVRGDFERIAVQCHGDKEAPCTLSPKCHPGAPVTASYEAGVIILRCAALVDGHLCGEEVVQAAISARVTAKPRHKDSEPLTAYVAGTTSADMGPCCSCGGSGAKYVVNLNRRAPVPGTGWGCFICCLGFDGAVAVICETCYEDEKMPK